MDKPFFVDYESTICSGYLNTVANTVWDALGQAQTPSEARQFIGAVEEAPNDGSLYLRSNLQWVSALTSLQHNDLAGRSTADAHPISAITGLQDALDLGTSNDAAQDALIALKADITYVDSENDAQDAAFAAADALNVKKTGATGAAIIPVGTEAQRPTGANGLFRYNSDTHNFEGYSPNGWGQVGGGQMYGNAPAKAIFYNAQAILEDVTIEAGTNGGTFGPITIGDGFEVTVESGSVWSVV